MEIGAGRAGCITIDPRTKLLGIVAAGALLVGTVPLWAECTALLLGALLLCNYQYALSALKFISVFAVMLAIQLLLQDAEASPGILFVLLICQVLRKFIPCIMLGKVFLGTTTISQLMAMTQRMHIPYHYCIPLAVIIRFFPTLMNEWESIRMAMKMRGIRISLEHLLVPLLNSAMRISDELSAAALSRGLGSVACRTNVCQVQLRAVDWLLMAAMVCFTVGLYLIKY